MIVWSVQSEGFPLLTACRSSDYMAAGSCCTLCLFTSWSVCCTPALLSLSPAAQWHETVHERLPQPHSGWRLQLCGQWSCEASCWQPRTPSVQPHRLEEEKARTHKGQPACESQQIMVLTDCPRASGTKGEPRPASSTSTAGCRVPPSTGHSACLCGGRIHLTEQLLVLICEALLHVDVRLPA